VETTENRGDYTRFRRAQLKDGFMMLQFSVYARFIPSEEAAEAHRRTLKSCIPLLGQVRLLAITDHQFAKMEVFYGRKPRSPEDIPEQVLLFWRGVTRNPLSFNSFRATHNSVRER
jgi:CRISPR-associated protein Cas2